jgi:hypothetical protein
LRLTALVNLPAPGRRQCVYVGFEYALAHTCVFAKQSLDAILCGRVGLGLYGLTYYRHPLSRSYGVILPSSFSVNHSSTLGYSPRLPVSDYGTVTPDPTMRGFSWQSAYESLCGGLRPLRHRLSTIQVFNSPETSTALHRHNHYPTDCSLLRPPSSSNGSEVVREC